MTIEEVIRRFKKAMAEGGVEIKIDYTIEVISVDLETFHEKVGKNDKLENIFDNKFSGGGNDD